ncbi:MAG: response regulator [Gammaproteobacteria bacterium]|nr:MAG: response regulator [Gammaproteobacteria bacterium]
MNKIILLNDSTNDELKNILKDAFEVIECSLDSLAHNAQQIDCPMLLIGPQLESEQALALLSKIKESPELEDIPIIVLTSDDTIEFKVRAFEKGASECLDVGMPSEEFIARINRVLMHTIANRQLKGQLKMAHEVAMVAMNDASDLGINLHFLIEANRCQNLDELGLLLLQATNKYGLRCSLQIRSRFGEKNLELNGMPKELESQLLRHMHDSGRFISFGKRLVINYGQASLLVKNMPVDDEKRTGALRDNLFYLVQGCDARVKALDDAHALASETQLLTLLVKKVEQMLASVDEAYQNLTNEIVSEVERLADEFELSILTLDLSESQEQTLSSLLKQSIERTNAAFTKGLRIDETTRRLVVQLHKILSISSSSKRAQLLEKLIQSFSVISEIGQSGQITAPPDNA